MATTPRPMMSPKRSGLQYAGPATPAAYDPSWQKFVNLTPAQVKWFQS